MALPESLCGICNLRLLVPLLLARRGRGCANVGKVWEVWYSSSSCCWSIFQVGISCWKKLSGGQAAGNEVTRCSIKISIHQHHPVSAHFLHRHHRDCNGAGFQFVVKEDVSVPRLSRPVVKWDKNYGMCHRWVELRVSRLSGGVLEKATRMRAAATSCCQRHRGICQQVGKPERSDNDSGGSFGIKKVFSQIGNFILAIAGLQYWDVSLDYNHTIKSMWFCWAECQ